MIWLLCAVIGYLLGSISIAVLLSRRKYNDDVRRHGSGNAGAANVTRVYGIKAGSLTFAGDVAKTLLAGLAGWLIGGSTGLACACAGCFIGHSWPVYFNFKGGKGVSVSAGIALLLDWRMFLIALVFYAVVFLISRRISVCSILTALMYPPLYFLLNRTLSPAFFVCCLVAVGVTFLHRSNIRRLLKGQEAAFKPGSSK